MPRKIKPRSPESGKQSKKRAAPKPRDPGPARIPSPQPSSNRDADSWLYGRHPVFAALDNPQRRVHRLLATAGAAKSIPAISEHRHGQDLKAEIVARHDLDNLLPEGAVHQGLALQVAPLEDSDIETICRNEDDNAIVVILDQVTDPRNIGAIMRSATAFGAAAIIVPDKHTPEATAVLAKAASGALDRLPVARVTNLARAIGQLKEAGFWTVGLDAEASQTLAEAKLSGKLAIILGAEGKGLRRLTAEKCDFLVKIPIDAQADSLNVSAAAAITLYEIVRNR
ncbi:MAG: 23S rRNA (guanosine(2251)-2'-O)-methyltransferase RlmB [Rhodospirillaceae bacterium]|nr:23S rRNA (guanosine(2251)-2'-O)-methyltransferase RlmB [Rhodospirillaceae bacterium]